MFIYISENLSYIDKTVVKLEPHDRGNTPGLASHGTPHGLPDDRFGPRACLGVVSSPQLGIGIGSEGQN